MKSNTSSSSSQGFTIVELLVVIVIIGILAAITIVSYSNVTQRARIASLQSDLSNNSKKLSLYYTEHGSYPTSIDQDTGCPTPPDTNYCLQFSADNSSSYSSVAPSTFHLSATADNISYAVNNNSTPTVSMTTSSCPTGFIPVPGSGTYGTNDFCVMKYEAKADDNGDGIGDTSQNTGYNTWPANTHPISATRKLVSSPQGYPVVYISQTSAPALISSYTAGCDSGCHLITEAEWMTIAQNVLSVPSNWSGGAVGSGYIYRGHSDDAPATALEADAAGLNGYAGTGDSSPSTQRRTLTLTNGEVIWDMAGNVYEFTQGTIAAGQMPGLAGESALAWKEWNNSSLIMNGLPALSQPSSIGISGVSGWNSAKGIGQLYSNYGDTLEQSIHRGGYWSSSSTSGIFAIRLNNPPSYSSSHHGFRVTK